MFVICAPDLSTMLTAMETSNEFQGVWIAMSWPPISHLFFADDNLIFFKAKVQDSSKIRDFLKKYEITSGQLINFEKSALSFSPNASTVPIEAIKMIFTTPVVQELLVRRISSLAQLPIRRTPGAAGYDISIAYAQDIPAKGRSLLSTGICIQIPQNTYARIAPRSSTALQGIIIMGGVIDSDYRGEVKIMAFNTTNNDIFLNKQEYIAQLIIEYIATPTVREVEVLNSTPRGVSGFGSTTTRHGCSHIKADPKCTGCHYCCSDEEYAAEYPEYVAARPQPEELLVSQNFKGKEVMKIKPFPNENY
ncbi:hypothetical protein ZIOFF_019672 [Zingiber officinale]|uniref:Deoxyuridine 5'-triphosphate nucleotidohydrolase n=1 Tax=Zingiber officinale TaxID=94328 RepID=A0A8J5H9Y3_ZINOF|nr:hypothetical protein ZIOFF_019672 [Zingiber officinale]